MQQCQHIVWEVPGARLCGASAFEANGRGGDRSESVSVVGNKEPWHLAQAVETAPLCREAVGVPLFACNM